MITATPPTASDAPPGAPARIRELATERTDGIPSWVLLIQLFIGLGWARAAVEKVIDPAWWQGLGLAEFLVEHEGTTVAWFQPFIDQIVSPNLVLVAYIVILAQLAAAASLLSGRHLGLGLVIGITLNLSFVAAGAVNPSAFYLLSQGALALWLAEQTRARHRTVRLLSVAIVVAAVVGAISLPSIMTLHPADVIDDPAVMLALSGLLTVIACASASRQITEAARPPSTRVVDRHRGNEQYS